MKEYDVEMAELQIWRIYLRVKAKDEEEAMAKAERGEGEVISQGLKDVDNAEVLDIEEVGV